MFFIKNNLLEKELFYDGNVVLKYRIQYPSIISNQISHGIIKFNLYNQNLAFALQRKAETELYKEAIELYQYNKENGYPIMVYEIVKDFKITFNASNMVSLYSDEYTFTGGAHGNTIRTSQTWNLLQGFLVPLEAFFPSNPYFILNILKQINSQIQKEPDIYFENTCQLVLETFNPQSFYLTPNGIVIYFQQYDIAPYSSGIRTFLINY